MYRQATRRERSDRSGLFAFPYLLGVARLASAQHGTVALAPERHLNAIAATVAAAHFHGAPARRNDARTTDAHAIGLVQRSVFRADATPFPMIAAAISAVVAAAIPPEFTAILAAGIAIVAQTQFRPVSANLDFDVLGAGAHRRE
jgi:hypothetical protein